MYNVYLILGQAQPGREAEFDDWYVWVHTRDVMRPRVAAIAAQCFRRTEVQIAGGGTPRWGHDFLCLYENTDALAMTGPGGGAIPPDMLISSAADFNYGMGGGYYDTLAERTRSPGQWEAGELVAEWIEPSDPAAAEAYVAGRFARLVEHPDVVSGWFGKASEHQIFDAPRPGYVAFYRVANLARVAQDRAEAGVPAGWGKDDWSVTCFKAISPRVTRAEMLEPDAAAATREAQAREAVNPVGR
jgi:hypothetical protein